MEDLIKDIQDRTGLPADKVLEVVTMVTEYLRNALPEELVQQVSGYLGSAADSAGGVADSARNVAASSASAASGAVSSATDVAQSAFNVAKDAVQERISPGDG